MIQILFCGLGNGYSWHESSPTNRASLAHVNLNSNFKAFVSDKNSIKKIEESNLNQEQRGWTMIKILANSHLTVTVQLVCLRRSVGGVKCFFIIYMSWFVKRTKTIQTPVNYIALTLRKLSIWPVAFRNLYMCDKWVRLMSSNPKLLFEGGKTGLANTIWKITDVGNAFCFKWNTMATLRT